MIPKPPHLLPAKNLDDNLYQLIFVSTASPQFHERNLSDILAKAHQYNPRDGITGLLLYQRGHFMQFNEGPEDRVWALKERVEKDPRNMDLKVIMAGPADIRQFSNWSMACPNLNLPQIKDRPELATLYSSNFNADNFMREPEKWRDLLLFFNRLL